jgi:hypothetical protein
MRILPVAVVSAWLVICLSLPRAALCDESRDQPPRFEVPVPRAGAPLTFVVYGDTRFTRRTAVANPYARQMLVGGIARESPAAVLIGGDLVYEGNSPEDYDVFRADTAEWSRQKIRVFPALGNHEFRGCPDDDNTCLENWWNTFVPLRPFRWYSVSIGTNLLALVLDSDASLRRGSEQWRWFEQQMVSADPRYQFILIVLHFPPVRDAFYPPMRDEKEIARYLSRQSKSLHARVVVVGSHVHNYERYQRDGVTYLVSGGGGAKPHPAIRLFGELSQLKTAVNFHYLRFRLEDGFLSGTMVRFDPTLPSAEAWSEPDRFEVNAKH